jgi:hypothetical protein
MEMRIWEGAEARKDGLKGGIRFGLFSPGNLRYGALSDGMARRANGDKA